MKIIFIVLAGLMLVGCNQSSQTQYLKIRHGEILLDNLAQECTGELNISYRLSADSELLVTCTQTGPIENSLLTIPGKENK